MSTSAVTALLDRLEKRGLVERHRDPGDAALRDEIRHDR
jgi:DNA-binding MarR family transcriptional regulator